MNKKINKTLRGVGIITLAVVGVFILQYAVKNIYTHHVVEHCAEVANRLDYANGTIMEDDADWWGKPIKIYRIVADDNRAVTYAAVAAGEDGLYETDDDFVHTSMNVNWSKIVGEEVGEAAKEAKKGFLKGFLKKNPHENEDTAEQQTMSDSLLDKLGLERKK